MFSLQTIFCKGDKFYGLLEASADAARQSTRALIAMLNQKSSSPSLDEFRLARRREKDVMAQISHELVNTFVTALERERTSEALSAALATRFPRRSSIRRALCAVCRATDGRRLRLACGNAGESDRRHRRDGRAAAQRHAARGNENLTTACRRSSEADRLILSLYGELFANETNPLAPAAAQDLFELLEKAIDRCRDAGNVIYAIALKNS
jgi:hypothetical protein